MNEKRCDTLFSLRYAVRVLERQARMYSVLASMFKFASILSGTMALGAVTGARPVLAVGLGLAFAVFQAMEHAVDASAKRSAALAMRRDYAGVLANHAHYSDADLEAAYQRVVASDEVVVSDGLKSLAYNDVVREQGLDPAACFIENRMLRALS